MTKWKPMRGRVVIRPDETARKIGSIIVPDYIVTEMDKRRNIARTGVVVAMGDPVDGDPGYAVGDHVVYIFGNINEPWGDELRTAWCAQSEILAVLG